ncbi:MAG: glutamate formiminotransferase [Acidimicrobiales bacterium]
MLECVVNVSEGRRPDVVAALAAAGGRCLLDVHSDPHHHRTVLTLAGGADLEAAVAAVAAEAVRRLDLGDHVGAHPRLGVVDVVPFVPLGDATLADAVGARGRFATWAGADLALPSFLYGPERSLPEVRRRAFVDLPPDAGPAEPHPSAGAACVGARGVLVAYNVWLAAGADVAEAREVAAAVRGPSVRALGLDVGGRAQVSMNLLDPGLVGPAAAFDAVAARARVAGAELVGLVPAAVLAAVPEHRWAGLDLAPDRTIEARLA